MKRYPEPVRFVPSNPQKYVGEIRSIVMRSSWESKFACWCDTNPNVLKWGSEIKAIPYYSTIDGKVRRYYPDFWVLVKDKNGQDKRLLIEIKPRSQILPPKSRKRDTLREETITWKRNQDKWAAAREYAARTGFEFVLMDEYSLGIQQR